MPRQRCQIQMKNNKNYSIFNYSWRMFFLPFFECQWNSFETTIAQNQLSMGRWESEKQIISQWKFPSRLHVLIIFNDYHLRFRFFDRRSQSLHWDLFRQCRRHTLNAKQNNKIELGLPMRVSITTHYDKREIPQRFLLFGAWWWCRCHRFGCFHAYELQKLGLGLLCVGSTRDNIEIRRTHR